ncbi:putative cyanate transporter [compost metagenome]
MQGFGFILAATGPWVAAHLHHLSGDFASAWQWQLGGLMLMSLLVLRLNPRHYARVMGARGMGQPAPLTQRAQTVQSDTPA